MTSVFPDFPHSVDDEPTDSWTVEELMQWVLLKSHQNTDRHHEERLARLDRDLEEGVAEIWKCHEQALKAEEEDGPENANPQSTTTEDDDGDSKPQAVVTKKTRVNTIHVGVKQGPYEGQSFKLQLRPRAPCWVGRSAGKKFRDRGISLAKDAEVSTTHGKFELISGKAYFTDTGSTNGTQYNGQELDPNEPLELNDGMVLKIGATVVKITLEAA